MSSYAANMAVKNNSLNLATEYPLAACAVQKSFYVDNCLAGADAPQEAFDLYQQLQYFFKKGGFLFSFSSQMDLQRSKSHETYIFQKN